jgi:hypothetical protein
MDWEMGRRKASGFAGVIERSSRGLLDGMNRGIERREE